MRFPFPEKRRQAESAEGPRRSAAGYTNRTAHARRARTAERSSEQRGSDARAEAVERIAVARGRGCGRCGLRRGRGTLRRRQRALRRRLFEDPKTESRTVDCARERLLRLGGTRRSRRRGSHGGCQLAITTVPGSLRATISIARAALFARTRLLLTLISAAIVLPGPAIRAPTAFEIALLNLCIAPRFTEGTTGRLTGSTILRGLLARSLGATLRAEWAHFACCARRSRRRGFETTASSTALLAATLVLCARMCFVAPAASAARTFARRRSTNAASFTSATTLETACGRALAFRAAITIHLDGFGSSLSEALFFVGLTARRFLKRLCARLAWVVF